MKKLFSLLAAGSLCFLCASSCAKETAPAEELPTGDVELTAMVDESCRSALDGTEVIWQVGDCINVMTIGSHNCGSYSLVEGAGSTVGKFLGGEIESSKEYYALYPFMTGISKSNSRYGFRIAQDQTWQNGSFGQGANIMVATFKDPAEPLQFKNVLGLLKISLTGSSRVYKISVSDGDAERMLWGTAKLLLDGNQGTSEQTLELTGGDNTVNLLCPNGVQLSDTPTPFFIALPPAALSSGMTVRIYGEEEILLDEFTSVKNNAVLRSEVRAMPSRALVPDPSLRESANCYILYKPGPYKIKAVKGNSAEALTGVKDAVLLWEGSNSTSAPAQNSILSNVSYANGYVYFTLEDGIGNAVVAVRDSGDNILWSWHIWVPDTEVQALPRASDYLMDRNLGASRSESTDGVATIGLFYEWGRKDPFPGSASWDAAGTTISYMGTVGNAFSASERNSTTGTVTYAIAHPQEYLYCKSGTDSNQDWLYEHDNTLWAAEKTIYDPCPAGWHLAPYTDWSNNTSFPVISFEKADPFGAVVQYYGDNTSWFPAGGYRYASDGGNHNAGAYAYYWSYSVNVNKSRATRIKIDNKNSSYAKDLQSAGRATGCNVRCIAGSLPAPSAEPRPSGVSVEGTVSCAGQPVGGVVVSDGVEVAVTDASGHYELVSKKQKGYVFVSIPSGYKVATRDANTPDFYKYTTQPAGTLETLDFTLLQDTDQSMFKCIVIGDIQVNNLSNGDDIRQFNEVFIPDFNNFRAAHSSEKMFILTLGDLSWNDYWADHHFNMDDYKAMFDAAISGIQVFNTPGNHDNDRGTDGVFPQTNDECKAKYRSLFGPSNYSFNVGAYHFIVLDNVECYNLGQQDGTKNRGTMSYHFKITDEQLDWVAKDLEYVSPSTPLIISGHCPFYRYDGTERLENGTTGRLVALLGGRRTHLLSGHTHYVYNVDHLSDLNVFEHNAGGLAGSCTHANNFAMSPNGAPCGYKVFDIDGTNLSWLYKGYRLTEEDQFRVYDRNEACLASEVWIPSCTSEDARLAWETRVSWYLEPRTDNYLVINVFDYDPTWTVEAFEGSTPLVVEKVATTSGYEAERRDPLYMAAFEAPNYFNKNKTDAGSFRAASDTHMFRVQASSATSTVTIRVTNRFGRDFTKVIERPYTFSLDSYIL